MRIRRFNEEYEQQPKDWSREDNLYTFDLELTIRANSEEEAEEKMEVIDSNPDFQMGMYNLSHKTEGGETHMSRIEGDSPLVDPAGAEAEMEMELEEEPMAMESNRIMKFNEMSAEGDIYEKIDCVRNAAEVMDERDLSELVDIIKGFYGDDSQGEQREDDVDYVQKHAEVVDDMTLDRLCQRVDEMGY